MENRQLALEIFLAGVDSVKPDKLIRNSVSRKKEKLVINKETFDLSDVENIYVTGAGKASALMAKALEKVLGSAITGGHIVTKYGHSAPLQYIEVSEAGHPVPDENGLESTKRIISFAQKAGPKDLVFCLLSGGGSSLLTDIPEDCTLADIASMNDLLLKSGADITEINCVRKHLSKVKGGQLAKIAAPATVISLILSDVIGDPIDVIASGPTAADDSTFADAEAVLSRYNLTLKISPSILKIIIEGVQGKRSETLKKNEIPINKIYNLIIGNNLSALKSAKAKAEKLGFYTHIVKSDLSENVENLALNLVRMALEMQEQKKVGKMCLLFGGESTVKITGNGLGGRNQHLALLCAKFLLDLRDITILSCGTDGTDGPTDAAGAVIDCQTFNNAQRLNINIEQHIQNCDSYNFFKKEGGLIITGPTQTNVMDMIVILIE